MGKMEVASNAQWRRRRERERERERGIERERGREWVVEER